MSTIRVELKLEDGTFTSRMLHAGQSVKQLEAEVGKSITSIQSMERASSSFIRTLGAATLAIGAVAASIGLLKGAANSLVGDVVRVNAEFERMNTVMRNMSTAADPVKDAANQVKFLREYAAQTPYSLKSLTDVFVRMKSTGIDPMTGAMKGLVDATAASGGTEQQLQRAALAISQMSGKGVIQMEELRQQLGEAIPRATELMARSMGVTYADLVQKISTGLVSAQPALQALNLEFERTFGGAAQAQMNTFNGLVNQTKTHISNLALAAGDSGFMAALKTQMNDLNSALTGAGANVMARQFGSAMGSIINGVRSAIDWVVRFRNELMSMAEMIAYAFAGSLAIAGISRMATGLMALTANVVSLRDALVGLTAAQRAQAAAQATANGATAAAAATAGSMASAIGVLRFAVGRLLPVLGVVGVIGAGVISFFDLFGSSARRAEQSMTEFGATSQKELDKFKADTEARRGELAKREATYAYYEKIRAARGNNNGNHLFANPTRMAGLRGQIEAERAELEKRDSLYDTRQKEFDVTQRERNTSALMRRADDEEQIIRRRYDTEQREADKARAANERAALAENRSISVVRQQAAQRQRDDALKFYDDLAAYWEKQMGEADERLTAARASGDKKGIEQALADQAMLSQRISQIRAQQDAQRSQALGVQIAPKIVDDERLVARGQSQLSKLKADIEGFKAEIAGASSESAKLAFQLDKVKFKDAGDNAVIRELINDIKRAQTEYEKLEELINGQKKLSEDIASAIRRAREERFEYENPGASKADKIKAAVKAGDYKGLTLDDNGQIVRTKEAAETLAKIYADPDVHSGVKTLNARITEQKAGIDAARDAGISANQSLVSGFQRSRSSVEAFNETLGRTLNLFEQMRQGVPNLAAGGFTGLTGAGVGGASWSSGGDFGKFIDKLTGVESGGNPNAKNGNSSATGLGQFISSTWMQFLKEMHPALANSPGALALRNDPGYSRQATEWYARKNASVLEMNGFSPNDANLYLAHFLGSAGATKLLRSDPNTSIRDVVGEDAYRANLGKGGRFVYGETAGEVLATIQRKFGTALSIKGQAAKEATPESIISGKDSTTSATAAKASRDYAAAEREAAAATSANEKAIENRARIAEESAKSQAALALTNAGTASLAAEEEKTAAAKADDYIRQRQLASKNGQEALKDYGDEVAKFREKVRSGEFGKNIDPDSGQYADQLKKLKEIDAANKEIEETTKRKTAAEKALESAAKAAREAERRNADTAKRNANPLGRDPSEDQSAALRRQSEERLRDIEQMHGKSSQIYQNAQAEEARILEAGINERASKRNMELAREAQDAERSRMNSTQSAQSKADAEIKALQDELAASQATGQTRIQQEEYVAKRIAQIRQQANASGPMAQAAKQWGDIGKNMETAMVGWIDGGIDAIAEFVATGEMNFKKLLQSIVKDITKMGLRYMMSQFMGGGGGGKAGKGVAAAAPRKMTKGAGGLYHTGGIIGGLAPMSRGGISPLAFAGAPRFHTGGIIGGLSSLAGLQPGEVPIIAQEGEGVFTPEQMKAMGGSNIGVSQSVTVNVTGGSSGNSRQDDALAENIAKRVQNEMRAMVGSEIKQQLRPNGMIKEATR